MPARYRDDRPAAEHWQRLLARHAGGTATVLLSSEEFSRGRPERGRHGGARGLCLRLRHAADRLRAAQPARLHPVALPADAASAPAAGGRRLREAVPAGATMPRACSSTTGPSTTTRSPSSRRRRCGCSPTRCWQRPVPSMTPPSSTRLGLRPPGWRSTAAGGPGKRLAGPARRLGGEPDRAPRIAQPALVALATEAFAESFGAEARSTLFTAGRGRARSREYFAPANRGLRGALPRHRSHLRPGAGRAARRPRPARPDPRDLLAPHRPPAPRRRCRALVRRGLKARRDGGGRDCPVHRLRSAGKSFGWPPSPCLSRIFWSPTGVE